MRLTALFLLILSSCNFTESKITYGNSNSSVSLAENASLAVVIQPHVVNRNQFGEQMTNIFDPADINFGTTAAMKSIKDAMSNSVWSSSYLTKFNTGDELGEGCDPYVMAYGGPVGNEIGFMDTYRLQWETMTMTNAKHGCHMIQASNIHPTLHAKLPSGKIDVYATITKIRWCESLTASVPSNRLGTPAFAWYNYNGFDNFGIRDFSNQINGATLVSIPLHKAFKSSQEMIDFGFSPDFTVDNIGRIIKLFYPTSDDVNESAAVFQKLDTVYPENGTAAFNAKQRYEKWKVVVSGTCQSLYWEIL